MRLKDYYGPPGLEKQLIDAIMRGERPQGMGPDFILDDDMTPGKGKRKPTVVTGGMAPTGMMPKINMSYR